MESSWFFFRTSCGASQLYLDILQKAPGVHTTAREPKRAQLAPTLQKHHQNSTRKPPEREKERKWSGRGKKKNAKFWAVRRRGREGKGGVGGRGIRRSAQILDAPTKILNTHRTDTPQHKHNTTPQRHTTQHNGGSRTGWSGAKGGPSQRGPWPIKQDMSNKLSLRTVLWFAKGWAQNGGTDKELARSGAGQKWSEKPENMEKQIFLKKPLPFTQVKKIARRNKHSLNLQKTNRRYSLPDHRNDGRPPLQNMKGCLRRTRAAFNSSKEVATAFAVGTSENTCPPQTAKLARHASAGVVFPDETLNL